MRWWYHSVGRYWLKAYDYTPYFTRENIHGISLNIKEVLVKLQEAATSCIAVINSSLFYFWWIMQSDEFHVLLPEITTMPLPDTLLADPSLPAAVDALMEDYKKKSVRKKLAIKGVNIEMDEIHARHSISLIQAIDDILAKHYNLTAEELEYLKKYDIRFRLGE